MPEDTTLKYHSESCTLTAFVDHLNQSQQLFGGNPAILEIIFFADKLTLVNALFGANLFPCLNYEFLLNFLV